ncbi:hypothetical protein PJJ26_01895 [Tenacibaculum finnmarkense]|nr:hypothetical protein PJJ26_01895 [Tenacibaculum finnmarkense]
MKKILGLSVVMLFIATSCGTVGIVSTPSNYVKAGKEVSAVKNNTNILGFTAMDTQKEAVAKLKELNNKCPNGVTNVTTTVSAKGLFIFGFEKLEMTANCK